MAPREGQKTNVFAPKDSVPVTIQKYTVNLYPKLPVDASIHKRAHTFFTNKAALDQIKKKIPMRMYLDHLCIQLGCVPSTQGLVHDWTNLRGSFMIGPITSLIIGVILTSWKFYPSITPMVLSLMQASPETFKSCAPFKTDQWPSDAPAMLLMLRFVTQSTAASLSRMSPLLL